jgi:Na+-translocating ferredoxin:NAD+ oxidoreductase subunit B
VDIYRILQERIHWLYGNFPETPGKDAKKILEAFFSEEEARVATSLHFLPQTYHYTWKILRKNFPEFKFDPRRVGTVLEELDRRGLIFGRHILPCILGRQAYSLMPFAFGIYELSRDPNVEQLAKADKYFKTQESSDAFHDQRQMRIVPINERIAIVSRSNLPFEEIEALIDGAEKIAAIPCRCQETRIALDLVEHFCILGESRKCLVFSYPDKSPQATDFYSEDFLISKQEAKKRVWDMRERGAVIQPENAKYPNFICLCCSCCCQALGMARRLSDPHRISDYGAYVLSHECQACGKCAKRCPMGAISFCEGKPKIDSRLCIGCGLCAEICESEAIRILRKFETPKPRDLFGSYIESAVKRFGLPKVLRMIVRNVLGIV